MKQRNTYNRAGVAALCRHTWLVGVLLLALTAATLATVAPASAQSAESKDFFGTVVLVSDRLLVVATEHASVGVIITPNTKVRLPLKQEALLTDLVPGDRVAVSLTDENGHLVADKVFLVPDKPRFRHMPGTVTALSNNQLSIQPLDANAEPVFFTVTETTPVRLRNQVFTLAAAADPANFATEGLAGRFVVMSVATLRNSPPQVFEILVVEGGAPVQAAGLTKAPASQSPAVELPRQMEIRGVFTGLDSAGQWIISGARVNVGPEAAVDAGVAVGQVVEVKARVDSTNILHALTVEREDDGLSLAWRIRLDGIFQGLDTQGRWVVSGTAVSVGPRSHTDDLPYRGQRVRVVAGQQEDGTLLAREVENRSQVQDDPPGLVELQGLLQGINHQGKWIVSGIPFAVGPGSKLEDSPAVGQPVKVSAIQQDNGSLLAQRIEGRNEEISQRRGQANVIGPVEQILADGSLVVNGVTIARTALTDQEGNPQAGNLVVVNALLLENGTLLAREVSLGLEVEVLGLTTVRESELWGKIERINPNATIVVGGVTVVIGALTEFRVNIAEDSAVRVAGVLQSDGSLLAQVVKEGVRGASKDSNSEVRIKGAIDEVLRDRNGNPVGLVVAGSRIALEALTRLETPLEEGAEVDVRGIISEEGVLASHIGKGKWPEQPEVRETTLSGRVKSLWNDVAGQAAKISVNGVIVDILPSTKLSAPLKGGELVAVHGVLWNGTVAATVVEVRAPAPVAASRSPFRVKAAVLAMQKDPQGVLRGLELDGRSIVVEGLTKVEPGIAVGAIVDVKGVIVGDIYVATHIKTEAPPPNQPDERGKDAKPDARDDNSKKGSGASGK
ncbi:MAG: hypothetical protein EXR54_06345 [Dehalococcoidia bacterium]|nr:hypothetical protein [Dehalococcoidia bacterium]